MSGGRLSGRPGRVNPAEPEWRVRFGLIVAGYHELLSSDGGCVVGVHLSQTIPRRDDGDYCQKIWCALDDLCDVVRTGFIHEPLFDHRIGPMEEIPPSLTESIGPFTVSYHAREKTNGERHIAVVIEQIEQPEAIEERIHRQRFVCDLARLSEIAGEGLEYRRVVKRMPREYAVVRLDQLSIVEDDVRWGIVEVAPDRWFENPDRANAFVRANAAQSLFAMYPVALRVGSDRPGKIEVLAGLNGELTEALRILNQERNRDRSRYILGPASEPIDLIQGRRTSVPSRPVWS